MVNCHRCVLLGCSCLSLCGLSCRLPALKEASRPVVLETPVWSLCRGQLGFCSPSPPVHREERPCRVVTLSQASLAPGRGCDCRVASWWLRGDRVYERVLSHVDPASVSVLCVRHGFQPPRVMCRCGSRVSRPVFPQEKCQTVPRAEWFSSFALLCTFFLGLPGRPAVEDENRV